MPLIIENVRKTYGGLVALDNVSLVCREGGMTAIVGGNGAGKTTLFSIIAGLQKPDSGRVSLTNCIAGASPVELTRLPAYKTAARGVGMLFQSVRVFERLSAIDNVLVGFPAQPGEKILKALWGAEDVRRKESDLQKEAKRLLDYVGLATDAATPAGLLSFGQQKLLAIARLLAAGARVLLFDEPTAGIHPAMAERILALMERLAKEDSRIIVFIEHKRRIVNEVADTVFVLDNGRLLSAEPRPLSDPVQG